MLDIDQMLKKLSLPQFIPSGAYYLVVLILLTRPDANKYLNSPNPVILAAIQFFKRIAVCDGSSEPVG